MIADNQQALTVYLRFPREHWHRIRHSNVIERSFHDHKQWRGLATRYDKLGANYQATLDLVELLDWLRAVPDRHDPRDRT